jgi:TonB family protein
VLAKVRPSEGGSAGSGPSAANRSDPRRDLVSAPPPAPGLFAGMRGTFDDLPDVSPGNLTMLNTKADRFAPFVRRVGTRVFQNLLIYQRRDLDVPEILAANGQVTIRALLDPGGRLKDLEVVDRSGSHAVDQTLLDALKEAAFDHNPPKEAANDDGDFEFLFQAQLSAGVDPSGGQIRSVESRLRIGLL